MLIELMLAPLWGLVGLVISLIPSLNCTNGTILQGFFDFLRIGLYFTGSIPFVLVLTNVLLWITVQIGWAIIEWIYKKIPGID